MHRDRDDGDPSLAQASPKGEAGVLDAELVRVLERLLLLLAGCASAPLPPERGVKAATDQGMQYLARRRNEIGPADGSLASSVVPKKLM